MYKKKITKAKTVAFVLRKRLELETIWKLKLV